MTHLTVDQLPSAVTSNIADAVGRRVFVLAVNKSLELGHNQAVAFAHGWRALFQSGYSEGDGGVFVRDPMRVHKVANQAFWAALRDTVDGCPAEALPPEFEGVGDTLSEAFAYARAVNVADRITKAYNTGQPRYPAGTPKGGQWRGSGAGGDSAVGGVAGVGQLAETETPALGPLVPGAKPKAAPAVAPSQALQATPPVIPFGGKSPFAGGGVKKPAPPKPAGSIGEVGKNGEIWNGKVNIKHPTTPTSKRDNANPEDIAVYVSPDAGGRVADGSLNGVKFERWEDAPKTAADWQNVSGQNAEVAKIEGALDAGKKRPGAGVIIAEPDGRVWVVEPTNGFGGYDHSFPKGGQEDEIPSLQANAIKEAYEESGLRVEIVGVLGDYERDTSVARYYIAKRVGGTPSAHHWESQSVKLVPVDDLPDLLNRRIDQIIADDYLDLTFEVDMASVLKYDNSQPRYPAGTPKGGQWKGSGSAGAGGGAVAAGVVMSLADHPSTAALAAVGIKFTPNPAADFTADYASGKNPNNSALISANNAITKYQAAANAGDTAFFSNIEAKGKAPGPGGNPYTKAKYAAYHQAKLHAEALNGAPVKGHGGAAGDADSPLKLSQMKQVGDKPGGTAAGGIFTDAAGTKWLVKAYKDSDQAKNEVLAANLYQLAGAKAPTMKLVELEGKFTGVEFGVASKFEDEPLATINGKDVALKAEAQKDFAADAWLANWDAVGLEYDNLKGLPDGTVTRIDPGGSILYRAQGDLKGDAFGTKVGEWNTLRDGTNQQAKDVFGDMTASQLVDSAAKVSAISNQSIIDTVNKFGPGDTVAKQALADKLLARKADIATRAAALKLSMTPPPPLKMVKVPDVDVETSKATALNPEAIDGLLVSHGLKGSAATIGVPDTDLFITGAAVLHAGKGNLSAVQGLKPETPKVAAFQAAVISMMTGAATKLPDGSPTVAGLAQVDLPIPLAKGDFPKPDTADFYFGKVQDLHTAANTGDIEAVKAIAAYHPKSLKGQKSANFKMFKAHAEDVVSKMTATKAVKTPDVEAAPKAVYHDNVTGIALTEVQAKAAMTATLGHATISLLPDNQQGIVDDMVYHAQAGNFNLVKYAVTNDIEAVNNFKNAILAEMTTLAVKNGVKPFDSTDVLAPYKPPPHSLVGNDAADMFKMEQMHASGNVEGLSVYEAGSLQAKIYQVALIAHLGGDVPAKLGENMDVWGVDAYAVHDSVKANTVANTPQRQLEIAQVGLSSHQAGQFNNEVMNAFTVANNMKKATGNNTDTPQGKHLHSATNVLHEISDQLGAKSPDQIIDSLSANMGDYIPGQISHYAYTAAMAVATKSTVPSPKDYYDSVLKGNITDENLGAIASVKNIYNSIDLPVTEKVARLEKIQGFIHSGEYGVSPFAIVYNGMALAQLKSSGDLSVNLVHNSGTTPNAVQATLLFPKPQGAGTTVLNNIESAYKTGSLDAVEAINVSGMSPTTVAYHASVVHALGGKLSEDHLAALAYKGVDVSSLMAQTGHIPDAVKPVSLPLPQKPSTSALSSAANPNTKLLAKVDQMEEWAAHLEPASALVKIQAMQFGKNTYNKNAAKYQAELIASLSSGTKAGATTPKLTTVKPKVAPFDASKLLPPVDFNNHPDSVNGPNTPMSNVPAVNNDNNLITQNAYALAQKADLASLQAFTFEVLDKATGEHTGKFLPISEHPSKHVKAYVQNLINDVDAQLRPPAQFRMDVINGADFDGGWTHLPNLPAGAAVKAVPKAHKVGLYVVLGKVTDPPPTPTHNYDTVATAEWRAAAADQIGKSSLATARHDFEVYVTSSGAASLNTALRNGDVNHSYNGKTTTEYVNSINKILVDIPEGTRFSRSIGTQGSYGQTPNPAFIKQIESWAANAEPGTVFQEPAFSSSSVMGGPTVLNGNEIQWRFTAGPGVRAVPGWLGLNSGEGEALFPPGQRYMFKSSHVEDGQTIIEAVLLPTLPSFGSAATAAPTALAA